MILGGGSNCQGCGCGGTCAACTRTCQNPHSGAAFQEVYRGYSFGAVNGLATDGYLTFSGDEDNPAFIPGGGPFHQAIGGTFNLNSSQTRFPCSLAVSFWRTLFPANATTDTALSSNTVTFTCVTGQFFLPTVGATLNPGDTYTFSDAVPVVPLFSSDPRSSAGSFGGFATCDNTQIGVQARIDWTSSERIHVLHGIVRECYEEGTPCATACSGSPANNYVYLTISNWSGPSPDSGTINGTYILDRNPNVCDTFGSNFEGGCRFSDGGILGQALLNPSATTQYVLGRLPYDGSCLFVKLSIPITGDYTPVICGSGTLKSGAKSAGTGGKTNIYTPNFVEVTGSPYTNSFDWTISK
jgi:hypothetical protein